MRRRIVSLVAGGLLVVSLITACGSDANLGIHSTSVPTNPVNAASDGSTTDTNADDEVAPTSTLIAEGKPSPTPLASATCSFGDPNLLQFQGFEEIRAEMHACVSEFAWPSGYEIDVDKIAYLSDPDSGGQVGVARTRIAANNTCAWMTSWQDATKAGDHESADKAIQYMLMILPYWNSPNPADPSTADPIWTEPARLAELGDPGLMVQLVNGDNCAAYRDARVNP